MTKAAAVYMTLTVSLGLSSTVPGATRVVPTQVPTIQSAISASASGDTVLVLPGTYVENILIDRDVVVRSAGGPAVTVIDGRSPANPNIATVVRMTGGTIEGFDIRNGTGSFPGFGGSRWGGGVLVSPSGLAEPLIRNNWIHDNTVVGPAATGGGIAVTQHASARILSNRIFHNVVEDTIQQGTGGAAVEVYGLGTGTLIEGNEIFDNHVAPRFAGFSGICAPVDVVFDEAQSSVRRNVLACNSGGNASAIYGADVVENNTVIANWSLYSDAAITVIAETNTPATAVGNNICYNVGPGLRCYVPLGYPRIYIIECNNIFSNGPGGQVVGACSDAIGRDGNISVDPQFGRGTGCPSGSGDWCLGPDSPLLPDNSPPGCGLIGALAVCGPIAVPEVELPRPSVFWALDPRPNPFAVRTEIPFHLGEPSAVEVTIYGVMGRKVRTLRAGFLGAGDHDLVWDARDDAGRRAAAGGYVAVIHAGRHEVTRTLLLVW